MFIMCTPFWRTRSSATAKSTARPSCLVSVLYDISREKICWSTTWAPKAAEFGKIRAIMPFKVIWDHRFWYQPKAHIRLPGVSKVSRVGGVRVTLIVTVRVSRVCAPAVLTEGYRNIPKAAEGYRMLPKATEGRRRTSSAGADPGGGSLVSDKSPSPQKHRSSAKEI